MLTVWGRKTSINVQKVMWAIGELGLAHRRIDIGGSFGRNRDADYLAKNPNGLVPVLEEDDGFTMWESNAIVRYLADCSDADGILAPRDPQMRGRAQMWMDWQLTVLQPSQLAAFWGLIRTAPDKRDVAAIKTSQEKNTAAMTILDDQLARTRYVAGDSFSYGDIPAALNTYRYWTVVPDHPLLPAVRRWYDEVSARPAFKEHVASVPIS
ncbi:MAG TPA: glutathione S-transferase family protein [Pseudolabrys sp.]|nr:glutathione S-transferase family protein [Pseudolabrys sp.]